MLVIANNISLRNRKIAQAFKRRPAEVASPRAAERLREERIGILQDFAHRCAAAGADVLELNMPQQRGGEQVMKLAVEAIQGVVDLQLCLSTYYAGAMEAGIQACSRPPIVNYVSFDEMKLRGILPLVAKYGAEVILVPVKPGSIVTAEEMVQAAAVLVGAANESGIPNDRILVDLGAMHVTSSEGQSSLPTLLELLPDLGEVFEPPVRTTCRVSNVSAGAPRRLRPSIESVFLAMLSSLGLSSAFLDVFSKETMRTVRLIRMLKNQIVYSERGVEL